MFDDNWWYWRNKNAWNIIAVPIVLLLIWITSTVVQNAIKKPDPIPAASGRTWPVHLSPEQVDQSNKLVSGAIDQFTAAQSAIAAGDTPVAQNDIRTGLAAIRQSANIYKVYRDDALSSALKSLDDLQNLGGESDATTELNQAISDSDSALSNAPAST